MYTTVALTEKINTPEIIYELGKKLQEIERILLSKDIPGFESKIRKEILRLRNTKVLSFFQDMSAQNKATLIEAAIERAKQVDGLETVEDFLNYSYKNMASIFQEVNELRDLSMLPRPTTTFKNLMMTESSLDTNPNIECKM